MTLGEHNRQQPAKVAQAWLGPECSQRLALTTECGDPLGTVGDPQKRSCPAKIGAERQHARLSARATDALTSPGAAIASIRYPPGRGPGEICSRLPHQEAPQRAEQRRRFAHYRPADECVESGMRPAGAAPDNNTQNERDRRLSNQPCE